MDCRLDQNLRDWVRKVASDWGWPLEQVTLRIGDEEIRNRIQEYPNVRQILSTSPLKMQQLAQVICRCWVIGGRFDTIRFNLFVETGDTAVATLQELITDFPEDDSGAIERIDAFITKAVKLGFSRPEGNPDRPGAAQLASLVLTVLNASRFVDFRRERWKSLAEALGYHQPSSGSTYGEWVVWAGKFASDICETKTFQEYWPESEPMWAKPLWVIAGICWVGLSPDLPQADPFDPHSLSFPEGGEKRRLHLIRERNQTVVSKAKALALEHDPMLRCEVCGFSYLEAYGERGQGFIEAHHKQPVAELKDGSRTRVEDIALVCANCHRMIHRGDRTLSIDELCLQLEGSG